MELNLLDARLQNLIFLHSNSVCCFFFFKVLLVKARDEIKISMKTGLGSIRIEGRSVPEVV